MNDVKPDQTFFTLRCWRENKVEQDLIKKIYSTNLLTPRERRTLAVYHSATYLRLCSQQKHFQTMMDLLNGLIPENEKYPNFLIELENNCTSSIRAAWSVFDSLAHEINLILWKVSNRKELFHPYIREKKISFYMVREKLLTSDKLDSSKISQLLSSQTRDEDSRVEEYTALSELATRSLHRPILLGHRLIFDEKHKPKIFLTESEGMPGDNNNLHNFEIIEGLEKIGKWLEAFVDEAYKALIFNL